MDLSIFATPEAWISLITLIFLEIVLGVDNIVFIAITTNRLPEEKQHIGRKLGLAGALVMRIVFLCFASYLIHMTTSLFDINLGSFSHGFSVRDIVLLLGGGYLIYKGISELRSVLGLTEEKAAHGSDEHKKLHQIMLPQAIGTIMVMDLVFSIDSVITAVGLADHLIIMILAVMIAVVLMMVFIDPISKFINGHPEMKILALCFIVVIGILLFLDSLGINSGIEVLNMHAEKLMVYFAMVFAFVLELIQMAYNSNLLAWKKDRWKQDTASQIERVKQEMLERFENEQEEQKGNVPAQEASSVQRITPVFIGSNVYIMMPIEDEDADSFRQLAAAQGAMPMQPTIEIEGELVEEASGEDAKPAKSESKGE
ncbi:MAG: TerC family protein [Raoultibacter sp.]